MFQLLAAGDAAEGLRECPTFLVDNLQVDMVRGCYWQYTAKVDNWSLSPMPCPPLPPHQLIVSAPTLGNMLRGFSRDKMNVVSHYWPEDFCFFLSRDGKIRRE